MKKLKVLAFLLLAAFLLSCAAQAEEASPWAYDSLNYCLNMEGELSGDVVIPAMVDGYAVNAIALNAFFGQNEITSLTMPGSLRALQSGAISNMDGLVSVTLNDGLEVIQSNFSRCNALTSLTIPASVRMVDAFVSACDNLQEIRFEGPCPLFLNTEWCFFMMPKDYTIYVPDDQLDDYAAALADANGAAEHLQPSGKNAVIPPRENTESWFAFDASTGAITGYKEYHAYVEFPETIGGTAVRTISAKAFYADYTLYGIVLPEGLEAIEAGAFQSASNLGYIAFPRTLRTIGDDAFFNVQASLIDWSEGLETIGARAFMYDREPILTLPSTVKAIGESAFEGAQCQELYLGNMVESIGPRAFAKTSLTYMAFDLYAPIDIAADAFAETHVADLDLPWDSTIANRDAYAALLSEQCPNCTVWINNPVSAGVAAYPVNTRDITTIEDGVWKVYNGDQADLTVWASYDSINVTALSDGLFKGNQTIRSFYPHHCGWFTTIGSEAFADSSVAYVELFPSITEIGADAFRNCSNITELTLPQSLTTIGEGAFQGCTGITELTLPASLTFIGEGALDGCDRLAKLTVLCDPAILPENLLAECFAHTEIYAAPDATKGQVALLSALAQRPWYAPVSRVGEPVHDLTEMPYAMLPIGDFWYDTEYARLDRYNGYELNLVLPREAEGVLLTMIGGNMMSRACYGDNFDVVLPVVSLVIPETYTTIPAYAFQNCDALETVICYGPIENLPEGCFSGCTRLREVVFVNGVRNIDRFAFAGCPNLQTVYLGAYAEHVSESAFMDEYGAESFAYADCITDSAQMPDVDALLAAVKRDPMPEPTPEPTPEPAQPVGEEGTPFFGTWNGVSMELDGTTYALADFGMSMTLTFTEDGTVTMFDGEETDTATWRVENGMAIVDTMQASIRADGTLCLEEDGAGIIFSRKAPSGVSVSNAPSGLPDTEPAAAHAFSERLEKKYVMVSADVQGISMTPAALGGLEYALTFHCNGTVDFVLAGTLVPSLAWSQDTSKPEEIAIDYYGMPLNVIITDEGFDMDYFDSMMIHFAAEE